jgi:hypothetical protein
MNDHSQPGTVLTEQEQQLEESLALAKKLEDEETSIQ